VKITVKVDLTVAGGEYVSVFNSKARFTTKSDAYTFLGDQLTYRNGELEYVVHDHVETVFMDGDQPVGHHVEGGQAICASPGP
jgi:hypothetical protein